ncbi:MAG: tRNA (5-methylaminomethyl-2-thiouridine)(34)-methyltransferase MnmD [Saprospiraceae bacterium]
MEPPILIKTADGSHSLHSNRFEVAYHSCHGAIQETNHVFIEAGLLFQLKANQPLEILELGLGTGLNAFMTYLKAEELNIPVTYTSLEQFPISWELAQQCNYLEELDADKDSNAFQQIHISPPNEWQRLSSNFRFKKINADAKAYESAEKYSLVYYDAFAPDAQPELWTASIFQRMYDMMLPGGVLVTYCAKGVVKRTLKAVGFRLESIPGPPGKREMTRAHKD